MEIENLLKPTDVKDGESLAKFQAQEQSARIALEKQLADANAKVLASDAKVAEALARVDATAKAVESLTFMMKDKWKDTEPPKAKAYGIGRMVKAMMERDSKTLASMNVRVNRDTGTEEWKSEGWEMKSDLGTPLRGDATTGSYLIPTEYSGEVMRIALASSAMMPLVRTIPMRNRSIIFPSEATGLTFSWPTNEATAKTEKNPTFGQVTLNAQTAAGWIAITEELNEDSLVPIGEYFRDVFGEAWGQEFDKQCLTANAAPFSGVLRETGVYSHVMDVGKTTFDSVEPDDIKNLIAKLTTSGKRVGARLFMHQTVWDVLLNWRDAMGSYALTKPIEGRPASIFGYPVTTSDQMPDVASTAVSTAFVAFGNPRYILHGDRMGFEFRVFDNTEGTMQYDRIYLRARLRQGFEVAIPTGFAKLVTSAT